MSSPIKPTPIALVLCDTIYQEPGGKTALVGLFSNIRTLAPFPLRHSRMAVFASVTGLRGKSTAKIEIVHGENENCILTASGEFSEQINPLNVVDMHFIFNNVVFPEEGTYFIRFWSNEHLLLQRPFDVSRLKQDR